MRRNEHIFEPRESELDVRQGDRSAWLALDSVYVADVRGPRLAAGISSRARRDSSGDVARSFAILRRPPDEQGGGDQPRRGPAGGDIGTCGRRYSLALLALLDALAAEPPRSPLATESPLDDLRATAFLVAGATVAERPNLPLIDHAVKRVDRRLSRLHLPLRATGYLAARDALRRVVAAPIDRGGPGGS